MLDHAARYNDLASIHVRWAILKPEFDELFAISHTLESDELKLRYDALMNAKQGIVPIEPPETDEELMHQSWRAEMHARGKDDWVAQLDAMKNAQNN